MSDFHPKATSRIVIVHGPPDENLVEILRSSFLVPIVIDEVVTIWMPRDLRQDSAPSVLRGPREMP